MRKKKPRWRKTPPYRAWINQPSALQPCHELHGINVIAYNERDPNSVRIYFLEGVAESQLVSKLCISKGWR